MELRADVSEVKEEVESSSVAAVTLGAVAMAGALLSPFAIAYGQLMFVPVLTLVAGVLCYSILENRRSKSFLKKWALISTVIAAITGGWAFAETKFRNDVYYDAGGKFAQQWLQYISDGKRELAFEMTINEGYRQLETMDLVEYYKSDLKAQMALLAFYERPGMKPVLKRASRAKWKYFSPRGIVKTQLGEVVKVCVQDTSGVKPLNFIVSLMRSTKETTDPSMACWYVMEVEVEV
jgi:hypothetical protein